MRILCLQQSSIFESYGGIEYYLHDFLTLASDILGPSEVATLVPQRAGTFSLTDTSYEVIPIPFTKQGLWKKLENRFSPAFLSTALQKGRDFKPDLILTGHISLAPLGFALSKILKVPYWTIAYGLEVWGSVGIPYEWALRTCDKIISISHWTKNILVARGFPHGKIEIVHPCLQPEFGKKPAKTYSSDTREPLKLLTVSRLDPNERYKGHDHVLSAMNSIKEHRRDAIPHYTIQGYGADRSRLEKMVFYFGLQEHVTFLDKLSCREELEQLYRDCDVFIMPSRFGCWEGRWRGEGFGIVYVEAGALGVPSIAYDCGGATDIIRSGINGLLVKQEQISLLGAKAREVSLSQFSRETIKTQMEKVLGSSQSISEIRPSSDSIDVSHIVDTVS
ncbi:glycosyltransferase [bacterium]|nr:glycosyltransferase [bacterium]